MGSGNSKDSLSAAVDPSSASSSAYRGSRRLRSRLLGASCFGLPSAIPDDLDVEEDENGSSKGGSARLDGVEIKSSGEISERSRKLRSSRNRKMPPLVLCDVDRNGEDQESGGNSSSQIELGSSNDNAAISLDPTSRSRSRFGFISDRIAIRLGRTASLGSSRAQSLFLESDDRVPATRANDVDNRNDSEENVFSGTNSSQVTVEDNEIVGSVGGHSSHRSNAESATDEIRRHNRRNGPQEPLEGSVRFSRTLSVGRLRDRVLRRTSSSGGLFGAALLEERSAVGSAAERRALSSRRRLPSPPRNEIWPEYSRTHPYHIASLTDGSYDSENGSSQLREGSSHDLLEHRSAFLERRRRIRSQVRALQRLGSRFENLSGHERSCILSGQHRTGRCTCRASNRAANASDDTGTRASISRIVMLAEALFEVLDEIHQQSVALSARPSFSSIGSVPAPKEVVECMPVKVYMKPSKHQNEEAAQCYICLVEYEDGDFMRILPCNHEFHRTCIDKWLKEIHRVCPLCRGDVCRSESSGTEKIS